VGIKSFIKIHFLVYKLLYTSKCTFLFAKKCDSMRELANTQFCEAFLSLLNCSLTNSNATIWTTSLLSRKAMVGIQKEILFVFAAVYLIYYMILNLQMMLLFYLMVDSTPGNT
jgi:hypothetical protein